MDEGSLIKHFLHFFGPPRETFILPLPPFLCYKFNQEIGLRRRECAVNSKWVVCPVGIRLRKTPDGEEVVRCPCLSAALDRSFSG